MLVDLILGRACVATILFPLDLRGILDYCEDEIVSADIIGDPHSGIVDASSTRVILDRVVKVLVWYDNEFGYARRLLELAEYISCQ